MRIPLTKPRLRKRKAVILLAVLVVVVLLTLAAYQYSELVTAEYRAADSYARSSQARAFAASGVHYVAAIVGNPTNYTNFISSNPYDNQAVFSGVIVAPSDQPKFQGRFSIISPPGPDDPSGSPFRFGVTDEGGKININALYKLSDQKAHDVLMGLPGMTEDITNSILDWIDPDDTPRSSGAESDYYSSLSPPYQARNGPISTPEELLLVRGVSAPLFLGNDLNRNGVLDPGEDDGTGAVNHGWSAYITCFSRELNLASDGTPRIYINDNDLDSLYNNLLTAVGQDLADWVRLVRQYGANPINPGSRPSAPLSPTSRTQAMNQAASDRDSRQTQPKALSSMFDLVNSTVSVPVTINGQTQNITVPGPMNDVGSIRLYLPMLMDKTTRFNNPEIPARINVLTAPEAVLNALLPTFTGLSQSDAQTIITNRPPITSQDAPDQIFQTPAWLMTEANFTSTQMKALEQYVTSSSLVYRIQSIGYFDGGGPSARIEAVIDGNNQRPRIISWRDLTELGKGFNVGSQ